MKFFHHFRGNAQFRSWTFCCMVLLLMMSVPVVDCDTCHANPWPFLHCWKTPVIQKQPLWSPADLKKKEKKKNNKRFVSAWLRGHEVETDNSCVRAVTSIKYAPHMTSSSLVCHDQQTTWTDTTEGTLLVVGINYHTSIIIPTIERMIVFFSFAYLTAVPLNPQTTDTSPLQILSRTARPSTYLL